MTQRMHISDAPRSELVVIGSQDAETIDDEIARVLDYISAVPSAALRDVARTCAKNAKASPYRIAIVATSLADLSEKLGLARRRLAAGNSHSAFTKGVYIGTDLCPAPGRTVFLFPGEGSQYPDMLREMTLHFPACRAAFDAADTAVASAEADGGRSPKGVLLPSRWIFPTAPAAEAPGRAPGTPIAIQAVLAADTAFLFLFTQLGLKPDAAMGVGVGELLALESAGAIPLPEKRNRIRMLGEGYRMISEIASNDKAVPDCATFSTTGLSWPALERLLAPFGGRAAITAEQTPELFTVCVEPAAAGDVLAALAAAGVSTRQLSSITKPFHSRRMEPHRARLMSFYSSVVSRRPEIPVYSCIRQGPIDGSPEEIAAAATEQWLNPVHVSQTIQRLYDDGFRVFVELGARGGMTTCVASTLRHRPHLALAANRGHRPDMLQFHHTLAALVSHGAELDVEMLFHGRSARLLDFDHPGEALADRRARRVSLPRALPVISDVPLPPGLVAPAPAATPAAGSGGEDPGRTDFPCLDSAEIVRFSPEDSIDLSLRFTPADFPYIRARALAAGPVSAYAKSSCGLLIAPIELLLEIMAETARKLDPGKLVVSIARLESVDPFYAVQGDVAGIRVQARRLPRKAGAPLAVDVAVYDRESFLGDSPAQLASCTVFLDDAYPAPPPPSPLALRRPIRVDWEPDDLYPARLFSGECCRAIASIPEFGENGLRATCAMPPRDGIVHAAGAARFSVSPVCLTAISDALSTLDAREPASGSLHIASGCDQIDLFAPQPSEGAAFSIALFAGTSSATKATADAELADDDHRLLLRATGFRNRVVHISPAFHRQILNPLADSLSEEVPKTALPTLPHEVICCRIGSLGPDDGDEDIRLRIAAHLTLSSLELDKWNDYAASEHRRHEWLFGRIAAKDAVRKCLLLRYGRHLGAADVRIESDEAGKPSPQGLWRKTCGARMDISITHTSGCVVAAAAPNASLGIDIENGSRTISEEFATFAFSQLEQEIAAESGDGATALFRFWCAKEALSKALGTGLRYGPGDLSARSLDKVTGKVEMEATRLWLNPFPHLKGVRIDVQTCLLDDIVLAVCALNPALVKSETGPFIRWN